MSGQHLDLASLGHASDISLESFSCSGARLDSLKQLFAIISKDGTEVLLAQAKQFIENRRDFPGPLSWERLETTLELFVSNSKQEGGVFFESLKENFLLAQRETQAIIAFAKDSFPELVAKLDSDQSDGIIDAVIWPNKLADLTVKWIVEPCSDELREDKVSRSSLKELKKNPIADRSLWITLYPRGATEVCNSLLDTKEIISPIVFRHIEDVLREACERLNEKDSDLYKIALALEKLGDRLRSLRLDEGINPRIRNLFEFVESRISAACVAGVCEFKPRTPQIMRHNFFRDLLEGYSLALKNPEGLSGVRFHAKHFTNLPDSEWPRMVLKSYDDVDKLL